MTRLIEIAERKAPMSDEPTTETILAQMDDVSAGIDKLQARIAELEAERDAARAARRAADSECAATMRDLATRTAERDALARRLGERWYIGAMNDGRFIINTPPRPSTDEVWHDRPDGPSLVLNVVALSAEHAQAIVDAHNASLATPAAPPGSAEPTKKGRRYQLCQNCGAHVDILHVRCPECGGDNLVARREEPAPSAEPPVLCRVCGTEYRPNWSACESCGAPPSTSGPLPHAATCTKRDCDCKPCACGDTDRPGHPLNMWCEQGRERFKLLMALAGYPQFSSRAPSTGGAPVCDPGCGDAVAITEVSPLRWWRQGNRYCYGRGAVSAKVRLRNWWARAFGRGKAWDQGRDTALANAAMVAHDMGHPDVRKAINRLIPDRSPYIPLDDDRSPARSPTGGGGG
jgi:outer membrane murein-binding lipoprotein Lpp